MNQITTNSLDGFVNLLGQIVIKFGFKIIGVLAIWIIGFWVVNKLVRTLNKVMENRRVDASLASFSLSFINIVLKVFVGIIILTTLGVQMTSIVAVLGAASLAVGMALSGTLQNVAGGLVILFFKPFKVGDTITTSDGRVGVVKKIMIFTTELHTFDNQIVFLPNGALANGVITNLSNGGKRRTDLMVGISYGDDIETARKVILNILSKDSRVLKEPEPVVFLASLDDSAVTLTVRYWTKYEDLPAVQTSVLETIYNELPKNKLSFPFPQMDVHITK